MSIRAIIVEDEPLSRIFLDNLLAEFCPQVEVIAKVSTEEEAVSSIINLNPDLVFLDIELQTGTGFDVLKRIRENLPSIIFTTATDHHAINAIRFSGVHYLLKPIEISDLINEVEAACHPDRVNPALALNHLLDTVENDFRPLSIFLDHDHGKDYFSLNDLIRIEGNAASSMIIVKTGIKVFSAKPLQEFDQILSDYGFCRIHLLHLVNTRELKSFIPDSDGFVLMSDGHKLPVSAKKVSDLKRFC
ncbi:MAG: response regulator transcription factor [Gemmatimonadaceae bacterium]|nr:response regulator transcription factor [Chitinophagaceae bacterium]